MIRKDAAIYALAASWASIDGRLEEFSKEKDMSVWEAPTGHYEGYMYEAEELLIRLERRGFTIVATEPIQAILESKG